MLSDALRKAAEILDREVPDVDLGEPSFGDARYAPVPFDPAHFRKIEDAAPGCGIGFVDGGNLELLHAPDFSIQLVRVSSVVFRKGERVPPRNVPQCIEFLSVARSFVRECEVFFRAQLLPAGKAAEPFLPSSERLVLGSRDEQLASGPFRVDISVVGTCARRFAEWLVLAEVVRKELESGDIAVRDGTLQTALRNETEPASGAFQAALDRRVTLTALAKTSAMFTSSGVSLLAAVSKLARDTGLPGRWYYHPLAVNEHPEHRAEIFACRLHPASKHVFRFEILREQARAMGGDRLARVFSELCANSSDLSFPGYPYGLVDADRMARVRRNEKAALQALVASALAGKGSWERVRGHLSATDAHEVLDSI